MAKRFTDTDKFVDPWYRRLSTKNKLLWDWILCNCDHAGIITVDLEFVEMVLAESYPDGVLQDYFSERIVRIGPAKYFIPKFIKFQYGKLNPGSKVHASVIAKLKDEGILFNEGDTVKEIENNARVIGYGYSMDRVKEKDKAIDKEMDKAKVIEIAPEKNLSSDLPQDFRNSKDSPKFTPDHVVDLWNAELGKTNGRVPSLGGNKHLHNCLDSLAYLPAARDWLELFSKTKLSAFLMGENPRGWKATLFWLVDYDNALKVISGAFDDGADVDDLFSKINQGISA